MSSSPALKGSALPCISLHCITLSYIASHCLALHSIVLYCGALQDRKSASGHCIALHYLALHYIVLHYITLSCNALHCPLMHCTARQENRHNQTLQHILTQHTVLHCSSLSERWGCSQDVDSKLMMRTKWGAMQGAFHTSLWQETLATVWVREGKCCWMSFETLSHKDDNDDNDNKHRSKLQSS